MSRPSVLVTAATGKTGRRVADRLAALGHPVIRASRSSAQPLRWEDPASWSPALDGVDSVYLCYHPDLAAPEAPALVEKFTAAARDAGVRKLVLLSGRGETNAQRCEAIVADSGLTYGIVRASWFNQNFTEGSLLGPVLTGTIAMPAGGVAEPFVDLDDVADVAVALLTDDRLTGRSYDVTGPRLLTFAQAAAEIADAAGRAVTYLPVTAEQFHLGLVAEVGPDYARLLTDLCTEVFDGRNAALGDGVERALGRPPRDFADFCRQAAAVGAWQQ
ncbi:NAD(P)H-binding protein [Solwaraspora sp. WMMA2056]|uniref:NAD(P)H-binding protein n=1 Tax=Solwaraspora sp. WMMA2056 TaxID=3015161 RepID=UPI00259BD206|nr:NAD(P)H-binding protein [Solwaraspora sp. WMMA2056]WJK40683.1 NAD(P)H-binding protein [Solwaraspora sp. WMMA2056]